jgi:Leucine-rich repeat (LRR) protein
LPLEKIQILPRLHYLKIQLPDGVTDLRSLPGQVLGLDVAGSSSLVSLAGINPDTTDLDISSTAVPNLRDVPDKVTTLRFESCNATGLSKFPANLKHLYLGGCSKLDLLEDIPKGLLTLDVHGAPLSELPELPDSLTLLDISHTKITRHLPKLPPHLEELILNTYQVDTLEGLPKTVKKLRFRAAEPLK